MPPGQALTGPDGQGPLPRAQLSSIFRVRRLGVRVPPSAPPSPQVTVLSLAWPERRLCQLTAFCPHQPRRQLHPGGQRSGPSRLAASPQRGTFRVLPSATRLAVWGTRPKDGTGTRTGFMTIAGCQRARRPSWSVMGRPSPTTIPQTFRCLTCWSPPTQPGMSLAADWIFAEPTKRATSTLSAPTSRAER